MRCGQCGTEDITKFSRCKRHGFQRRCRDCVRKNNQKWREAQLDSEPSEETRIKLRARANVNMAKRRGNLTVKPCESCGAPEAQAHHENYEEAFAVRWLCVQCHAKLHYPEAAAKAEREMAIRERFLALADKYRDR